MPKKRRWLKRVRWITNMQGKLHKAQTRQKKACLFMKSLFRDYQDNPEALQFVRGLSRKAGRNRKIRMKIAQ